MYKRKELWEGAANGYRGHANH